MTIIINGTGPIDGITSLNTTVSNTELGFLDGATSNIQTQINAKANISSPTFTGTVTSPLFITSSGNTGPIASGVSGTLFTMEANSVYLVFAYLPNVGDAGNYNEVSVCSNNSGTSAVIAMLRDAPLINTNLSGSTVRASQGSGTTTTVHWTAIRIA